jgi:hypothetical protein
MLAGTLALALLVSGSASATTVEERLHRVVETFVRSAPVMELEVIGGGATDVFVVTGEHPFWRRDHEGGGWVRAQDLLPGDEVFTSRGGWARIGAGTWLAREQLVYNFEVEGSHTYFVGETGTWVHNVCLPPALRGGPANVNVYYGIGSNGEPIYIGITNDVGRRAIEHGPRFGGGLDRIASGLTRGEARAIEQAGIVRAGGAFENRINSISPRHAYYPDAVRWGEDWLLGHGH